MTIERLRARLSSLAAEKARLEKELEAANDAWRAMKNRVHTAEATIAELREALTTLRRAVRQVVSFDWSDNDDDAVAAIVSLKHALIDTAGAAIDAAALVRRAKGGSDAK